jgi:hypothetical protein
LFESPIVSVLFALTFISLGWPMIGPILKLVSSSRRSRDEDK